MNTSALNVSARAAGSPRSFSATSVPLDMCLKLAGAHIPKWSLPGIRLYPGRTSPHQATQGYKIGVKTLIRWESLGN